MSVSPSSILVIWAVVPSDVELSRYRFRDRDPTSPETISPQPRRPPIESNYRAEFIVVREIV